MLAMNQPEQGKASNTSTDNRRASRLAWLLATAAIVGAISAFAIGLVYAITSGDMRTLLTHLGPSPLITIAFAVVGALVAARHPRNPIGWIFISVGLFYTLTILTGVYSQTAPHLLGDSQPPGMDLAEWLNNWIWIPAIFLPIVFVFLLFPDGRLLSPRWRVVLWSAALGLLFTVMSIALHPGPVEAWDTDVNPYGIPAAAGFLEGLIQIAYLLIGIGFVGAIGTFVIRFRRSHGVEREQMKWLAYAIVIMLLGFFIATPLWFLWPDNVLVTEISIVLTNLSILGIAVAASIAILRYRLYDIDLVINRTLVYGTLTICIVAIYVLIVGGLGTLFQAQGNLIIAILATGLVAVLFQPLRDHLQRGGNRLFYGQRDDPLGTLSQLGRRLETAIAPEAVLPTLVETIAQTLKLPYVAISLRTGEEFSIAAQTGERTGNVVQLPLIYQGETVGQLIASPRGTRESFSQVDQRLLENIAHQAGPAVHAVQLTVALQYSRQQLVTAREEERRRLRRDLHDGLGATLAALQLEAGILRRAIRNDPQKAEALADEFRADIRATIDDIRRLVYDLRPPTLDQLGLVAAVRAQALQCSRPQELEHGAARLQVEVEAPEELPSLPAAVEVAAYRIAQEALTNVVHHAQARHCPVRLEMADDLKLEILDDGMGLATGRNGKRGLGLLSMRERALELGGTCVIEPAPGGGTRVLASIPLQEAL